MKASLPFKYITAVKRGKHYVIFDYKDEEGNRKRKWVGTGLPEKCKKKDLTAKIDELVSEFYKEYIESNIGKAEAEAKAKAEAEAKAKAEEEAAAAAEGAENAEETVAEATAE